MDAWTIGSAIGACGIVTCWVMSMLLVRALRDRVRAARKVVDGLLVAANDAATPEALIKHWNQAELRDGREPIQERGIQSRPHG